MISFAGRMRDRLLGRGSAAITVPIFDGPLKPNQIIQNAKVELDGFRGGEDLASDGGRLFAANGSSIVEVQPNAVTIPIASFDRRISALAVQGDSFAVAIEGSEIHIWGGPCNGRVFTEVAGRRFTCVNALAWAGEGLLCSDGSMTHSYEEWRHDLMKLGRRGRICRLSPATGSAEEIASGMGYAYGVLARGGDVWASESWNHQVISISPEHSKKGNVIDRLPGYPSRLAPASNGGAWLSVFACRTQLVEFVLREPEYRRRMVESIPPDLWIAPQLRAELSMHEPLQYARLKQLGQVKPWAPPRSYGLVVRLNRDGEPLYSLHSRVDGFHHGIVACVELAGKLYLLSKGAGRLLSIDIATTEREINYGNG